MTCVYCQAQLDHTQCFNTGAFGSADRALEAGLRKAAEAGALHERARIVALLRQAAEDSPADRNVYLHALERILA